MPPFSLFSIRALKIILVGMILSVPAHSQFRVIGYVHSRTNMPDTSLIRFDQITHLNIAFVNPDSSGQLITPPGFDSLIEIAHHHKVKVLASIGGGSFNPYYASLLSDENRKEFVASVLQLVLVHQLDGIDVDIENENLDSNYNKLIPELARLLKPGKKLLTAAVATGTGDRITTETLRQFDFINVMSYDQTGPWRKDRPGPHSTYEKAEEDLRYWVQERRIKKKNVNLGLPFYGYCFGTQFGESISFGDLILQFPGAENSDQFDPPGGGTIYYNGIPTIRAKTSLAMKKAGGVMIWQLLQDAANDKSLLSAIHDLLEQKH